MQTKRYTAVWRLVGRRAIKMNDPLEKLLKKMELSCYGKESDLIYRGDALNAIRGACIMAQIPAAQRGGAQWKL